MLEMARVTGHATTVPDALHADGHPSALDTAEAPPSPSSLALIDPDAGPRRWGDDSAWVKALQQFAQAKQTWLDEQREDQPPSADAAANAGHRLKGVAANLGLPALQAAGMQLEQAARATATGTGTNATAPAWTRLLQILRDTLLAVRAHTSAPSNQPTTRAAATIPERPALPVLSRQDHAQLEHDLAELTRACHRGEHLEAVLEELKQRGVGWLSLEALSGLQQALDDFDFDGATRHLDTLKQGLAEQPVHERPLEHADTPDR
jgi:HPt (histidine-containing phosphotransfer) domain-containing protein